MPHYWTEDKEFTLLKGLIVGHEEDTYDDRALMPEDGKFVLVNDLIVGARIYGLYQFVEQPEYCQHATCGFDSSKKNAKGFSIKPKCSYVSFRKLTTQELSKPNMSSLHLAMNVSYLDDMDLRSGLAVFDAINEKFADFFFQDGGNDRLVITGKDNARKVLTRMSNYTDLVETLKSKAL